MKITVYTITDCAFSKQEKEYLQSHSLQFEEKNLETNREFLTEMLAVGNNFSGTPLTRIEKDDGSLVVLKGFTLTEFDKALGFTKEEPVTTAPAPLPTPTAEPISAVNQPSTDNIGEAASGFAPPSGPAPTVPKPVNPVTPVVDNLPPLVIPQTPPTTEPVVPVVETATVATPTPEITLPPIVADRPAVAPPVVEAPVVETPAPAENPAPQVVPAAPADPMSSILSDLQQKAQG